MYLNMNSTQAKVSNGLQIKQFLISLAHEKGYKIKLEHEQGHLNFSSHNNKFALNFKPKQ